MNRPGPVTLTRPLSHLARAGDARWTRLGLTVTLLTGMGANRTQITGHVASGTKRHRATGGTRVRTPAGRIT